MNKEEAHRLVADVVTGLNNVNKEEVESWHEKRFTFGHLLDEARDEQR